MGAAIRAATAFAQRYDPDPSHSAQVAGLALQLFDSLATLHKSSPNERNLLHIAALVHDTGWAVNPAKHHKGSRDLILGEGIEGLGSKDLRMVACIARYHRKGHPKPTHKVYRDLDRNAQEAVRRCAALLRIADGLDRSHASTAVKLHAAIGPKTVRVIVKQHPESDTDLFGAERKSLLFEEVFGREIELVRAE
jgi:exopolyphosphatase / guanosine-5'-triphosphate,3'-diphosphate pyrophosphatase